MTPSPQTLLTPLVLGAHRLPNRLFVAPMAGVTDRPFRVLCKRLGAGHAVSEMVTSRRELWTSLKTSRRADHDGESAPVAVQIAGVDPAEMADCARYNIDRGAQIIDINMGCPAKKVCRTWAGSALMQDEPLALAIVEAVVAACAPRGVPVTLKMRSGWCDGARNAVSIARAAAGAGVAMLTVHGRTREQGYGGVAEHDTVAAVKAAVAVPVVANGDIDSAEDALRVWRATGVDAVMIGRAAQGRPWIFGDIAHTLAHGSPPPSPTVHDVRRWLGEHLRDHHALYGAGLGTRSARKHLGWLLARLPAADAAAWRARFNAIDEADAQLRAFDALCDELAARGPRWPEVAAVGHADAAACGDPPPAASRAVTAAASPAGDRDAAAGDGAGTGAAAANDASAAAAARAPRAPRALAWPSVA